MAKVKNPDSQPVKKVSKAETLLSRLGKGAAGRIAKMARTPKFWLFLSVTIAMAYSLFESVPAGLSLGLLYLMPDGEAKSGRTGSVVYMRNGRRRNFVVPSLVQNGYTSSVRASFSSLSSTFKTLTQDQIAAWNSASGFFKSDRFGRSKEVKGKALFVMLNQNLFSAGMGPITDVPPSDAVVGIDDIVITDSVDPADSEIAWTSGATPSGIAHLIFATASVSPGISKPGSSEFRQIGVIPSGSTSPFAFGTMYENKFGGSTLGKKMFVKLVPVNTNTGQSGGAIVGDTIVIS